MISEIKIYALDRLTFNGKNVVCTYYRAGINTD